MKLYQKTKLGATKFIELKAEGPKLITTWGLVGGKTQTTTKVCKGMNKGKANATTPEQQAKLELKAKAEIKQKKGYSTDKPSANDTIVQADIDLDNIPESLCPNKPKLQKELPKNLLDGKEPSYGQRKHNGHCIFLVKGKKSEKIYSRRMEDLTPYVKDIPVIKEAMLSIPKESFVLHELVFHHTALNKQIPRFVAQVIRLEDAEEAKKRYAELSKIGKFSMIPFDALFLQGKFIGDNDYVERHHMMKQLDIFPPPILINWQGMIDKAKTDGWEGFVIRVPGLKSHISYTMDGTAHRAGSWKYKFVKEGDFFIDQVLKGKSGKHAKFYAKFHTAQYDDDGKYIDRGYVGAGKLTHEELAELTRDIDSGKRKLPFVVEIEYQSIHDDSGKLEFGQIQRIREDKKPNECISEE